VLAVKRVTPEEALELMRSQGYAYLDVRSVPEFAEGHPEGAYNVPLLHMGPGGSQPNPDFLAVIERRFAKDAPLVVGCRTAGRSTQAVAILQEAGFTKLALQQSGFVGASPFDRGWGPKGLPTSRSAEPGRSWQELEAAQE
jgi:rhodanese-related sulfurtransferase